MGAAAVPADDRGTEAPDTAPPQGPPSWRERVSAAALPVHIASLAVAFAFLLYIDRGLWFFYDEWDFLAGRGEGGRPLNLFVPHNEHWSTIPILIYRALYAAVGLHTYIPYLIVLLLAHVALAHVLFRIMRRLGVDAWIATAAAIVFLFLGAGAENLTWAFQMAWILTLLFGLAGLLLIDHDGAGIARDLAYWPVAVLALMCSGIAVPLVAVAGLIALLKRGWVAALRVVSVPAVVYVVWFALVGHVGYSVTHPTRAELLQLPQYVWTGLTTAVANTLGWQGSGAIVVLALSVFVAMQGPVAWRRCAVGVAMAMGAVLFFALTGVGRIALGIGESTDSRYAYVAIALLLPAAAWALSALGGRLHGGRVIAVALCAIVAINGIGVLTAYAQGAASLRDTDKYQLLAAAHLIVSGAPILAGNQAEPDPAIAPQLTLGELRSMIRDGAVPLGTPVPPDAVLGAALQLQVSVGETAPTGPGGNATIAGSEGLSLEAAGSCTSVTSYSDSGVLRIDFPTPGWLSLTPDENGTLGISLASTSDPGLVTAPRDWTLVAGRAAYVELAVGGMTPSFSLPPGVSILCGTT